MVTLKSIYISIYIVRGGVYCIWTREKIWHCVHKWSGELFPHIERHVLRIDE